MLVSRLKSGRRTERAGGHATCQRRIRVHVVFEQVVECVWEGVDGAGDGLGDAVAQGEREGSFVAGREGDILQSAERVFNLDKKKRKGSQPESSTIWSLASNGGSRYCIRVHRNLYRTNKVVSSQDANKRERYKIDDHHSKTAATSSEETG